MSGCNELNRAVGASGHVEARWNVDGTEAEVLRALFLHRWNEDRVERSGRLVADCKKDLVVAFGVRRVDLDGAAVQRERSSRGDAVVATTRPRLLVGVVVAASCRVHELEMGECRWQQQCEPGKRGDEHDGDGGVGEE